MKEKAKKPFYKKWWFGAIIVLFIIAAFMQPSDEEKAEKEAEEVAAQVKAEEEEKKEATDQAKEETTNEVSNEGENVEDIGKDAIAALKTNDFMKFTDEYKKLGTDKTPVWDNHLYGNKVTWTGTVVRAGSSQLFVYGGNNYNGETWDQLGEQNKLYISFVAKYADGTEEEFKKLQTGDQVTVEGDLESRGDFDLGFNWKIYNATLK